MEGALSEPGTILGVAISTLVVLVVTDIYRWGVRAARARISRQRVKNADPELSSLRTDGPTLAPEAYPGQ